MKLLPYLAITALAGTGAAHATINLPVADSAMVTIFPGQSAKINIVNLDPDPSHVCRVDVTFIDAIGTHNPPTAIPLAVNGHGGAATSGHVEFLDETIIRAQLDFTRQLLMNATAADPMLGCYRLAPSLEVLADQDQKVLATHFFNLPIIGKGVTPMKITICHHSGPHGKTKTLVVGASAWHGHKNHGDELGGCPD